MVVGFTTTYSISAYHHWCCEFESRFTVRCTTLYNKVFQWLVTGRWFSPSLPVSSINETDRHNITEIVLTVALYTKQTFYLSLTLHFIFKILVILGSVIVISILTITQVVGSITNGTYHKLYPKYTAYGEMNINNIPISPHCVRYKYTSSGS